MTRRDRAKCKAYAIWYRLEFNEWREDFINRLSRQGRWPSPKYATEFQALRRAGLYYLERLIEYTLMRTG
ncbi:hypothetical protein AWY79_13425 [Pseudodesulfovibrio indicus]|uniref:Transposase n=1 Tax=Pseudodesulfovibrio indicus TaxID=1716143 RepID=A0ABN4M103_9BACT|nr:hypothetical protein AWY79_13425 [Pseudodesulfovibrio indicus]